MNNITFTTAEIGRGLEAVYCWVDDLSIPASSVIFKQSGVCLGENETGIRITVVSTGCENQEYLRQSLIWLQQKSSIIIYTFGTTSKSIISKQLAFLSSGFRFDDKIAAFVWTRDENAILPSKSTDLSIAKLLGWSHFKENKEGSLFGIHPTIEIKEDEDEKSIESKLSPIPRWSREIAPALALLFELKEIYGFSNIFKQSGSFHFVSIYDNESNVVSGAHSEIYGAIADAIIRYLVECNNREALKEKSKEGVDDGTDIQS